MVGRGVVCGLRAGKSDWKIVVTRDSRCFGTGGTVSSVAVGMLVLEVKLFMTRSGAFM